MKRAIKAKHFPNTDPKLLDTHRRIPKAQGGRYTDKNTSVMNPVDHLKEHNNYRFRAPAHAELKRIIDDRNQFIKLRLKLANQLLAYKRMVDDGAHSTIKFFNQQIEEVDTEQKRRDKAVMNQLKILNHPITKPALGIRGVGPITVAYLIAYIDIEKAECASALWKYCGYHTASHKRYVKNETSGGNKALRSILFNTASSMIKSKSPYSKVYYNEKKKLESSQKMVETRNTQGHLVTKMWCETMKSHRHGAAMRKMIKHFLADLWFVWRSLEGLSTRPLYVEEKLGHTGIVKPSERGWLDY